MKLLEVMATPVRFNDASGFELMMHHDQHYTKSNSQLNLSIYKIVEQYR